MGTLEQTRDTRRLRWPLSLTRAPQKTSWKQQTTSHFLTTSVKAVIPIEEKRSSSLPEKTENLNLKDAFQQHPDQEPRPLLGAVCQGAGAQQGRWSADGFVSCNHQEG